jgi:aspartate/methionine/tyrosine aminotransferase
LADALIGEAGVASIPLSVFYRDPPPALRLLRLCFAKRDETLDAGAARLAAYCRERRVSAPTDRVAEAALKARQT